EKKLVDHQQKYFWLLNSYHHTQILEIDYFRKEMAEYSLVKAQEKYEEIKKSKQKTKKEKNYIIKKFALPNEVKKISIRLSFCIWWQDLRKAYIFQANHIIDLFLCEIARRNGVDFADLHFYTLRELEQLVSGAELGKYTPSAHSPAFAGSHGREISTCFTEAAKGEKATAGKQEGKMQERKIHFLAIYGKNKQEYIMGEMAKKIAKPYLKNEKAKNISEFKGIATSRGKVRGIVRIIITAREISKLGKGEILVTPMTSPDYIVGLRRAAAIITDHGGMTCHAAIVSRELKIPCIVGTRIATKVLKDGDMAEVDAERGCVKILK
ncbi:MAG: PEP-utilizing enzyme, partial [bacterium]